MKQHITFVETPCRPPLEGKDTQPRNPLSAQGRHASRCCHLCLTPLSEGPGRDPSSEAQQDVDLGHGPPQPAAATGKLPGAPAAQLPAEQSLREAPDSKTAHPARRFRWLCERSALPTAWVSHPAAGVGGAAGAARQCLPRAGAAGQLRGGAELPQLRAAPGCENLAGFLNHQPSLLDSEPSPVVRPLPTGGAEVLPGQGSRVWGCQRQLHCARARFICLAQFRPSAASSPDADSCDGRPACAVLISAVASW